VDVMSLVADREGAIWVGTTDGVTIFNCPQGIFDDGCVGDRPVINPDNFNGRLLEGENVKTIAVDGANRKWVGTDNGLFLFSADGFEQIHYFTDENSPLFDNSVNKVIVDGTTGTVYIMTEKGLQSYRGTATEAPAFMQKSDIYAYPNPVPPDYTGMIAITNLAEDADVKITDASGRLIYQTQAFGGQVVWDGADYNGRQGRSGVYFVFVVNNDGTQKLVTKLLKIEG